MVQDANEPVDRQDEPGASSPPGTDGKGDGGAEAAESEVESLRKELDMMKNKYLRSLADCQNIQKRAATERNEAVQRGQGELAKALLPVLDNFERTLEAARSVRDIKVVTDGVRIVYDQMTKVLSEFGLVRIALDKGDPFDPDWHQAIAQQPTDEVEPEHVLHVAQPGYTMRDRLLRPATVVVAKPVEPAASQSEEP